MQQVTVMACPPDRIRSITPFVRVASADAEQSARAEQPLEHRAAEEAAEHDEIEDHEAEQEQGRSALQVEALIGVAAGELGDDVAEDGKGEDEIENEGHHLAPGGDVPLGLRYDGLRHGCPLVVAESVALHGLDIDVELDRLPLTLGGNEVEVIGQAARPRVEIAAQEKRASTVDR